MAKSDFLAEAITDNDTQAVVRQLVVESELKYQTLVENALVGIYVINEQQVLYANPYLLNLVGYSESDYSKLALSDLIEPSFLQDIIEIAKRRMAGESSQQCTKFRIVCRDRRVIDVCSKGVKCTYQGESAVLGTLVDITKQIQNEARLQELEETLDQVPLATIKVNECERITYCNKHVSVVLTCDHRDIPGTPLASLIEHKNPQKLATEIMLACRKKSWTGKVRFRARKSTDFAVNAVPIFSQNNEFRGITIFLQER